MSTFNSKYKPSQDLVSVPQGRKLLELGYKFPEYFQYAYTKLEQLSEKRYTLGHINEFHPSNWEVRDKIPAIPVSEALHWLEENYNICVGFDLDDCEKKVKDASYTYKFDKWKYWIVVKGKQYMQGDEVINDGCFDSRKKAEKHALDFILKKNLAKTSL